MWTCACNYKHYGMKNDGNEKRKKKYNNIKETWREKYSNLDETTKWILNKCKQIQHQKPKTIFLFLHSFFYIFNTLTFVRQRNSCYVFAYSVPNINFIVQSECLLCFFFYYYFRACFECRLLGFVTVVWITSGRHNKETSFKITSIHFLYISFFFTFLFFATFYFIFFWLLMKKFKHHIDCNWKCIFLSFPSMT